MTMKAIRIEKGYADLDDKRHALGAGSCQHQSIFKRHESDDLTDGVRRVTMTKSPKQDDRQGKGQILARQRGRASAVTRSIRTMESATSPIPASMVGPIPHGRFDITVNPKLLDDAVKRYRDDDSPETRAIAAVT